MSTDLALRRKRNRRGQARYQARHFGSNGDLARVRVDVRLEARAALDRLAAHRNLSLTMLIEELAADSERALLARLRPEQAERYLAGDSRPPESELMNIDLKPQIPERE